MTKRAKLPAALATAALAVGLAVAPSLAAPAEAAPANGSAEWVWYCRTERFLGWTWQNCGYHLVYYYGGKWWF